MDQLDPRLDIFESIFRSAERIEFELAPPPLRNIALLAERSREANVIAKTLRDWLGPTHPDLHIEIIFVDASLDRAALLGRLAAPKPDLIVSQRHIGQGDSIWHRGLGGLADFLIQHHPAPLWVLSDETCLDRHMTNKRSALLIDFPLDNHLLVNWGVMATPTDGDLKLMRVEPQDQIEKLMRSIQRVKDIPTETTRHALQQELLHESTAFMTSCLTGIFKSRPDIKVTYALAQAIMLPTYLSWIQDYSPTLVAVDGRDGDRAVNRGLASGIALDHPDVGLMIL